MIITSTQYVYDDYGRGVVLITIAINNRIK